MSTCEPPTSRSIREPVPGMQPRRRWDFLEPGICAASRCAVLSDGDRTLASCEWKVSVSSLSRFTVAATSTSPRGLAGSRVSLMAWEAAGGADLDEGGVVRRPRCDGLAEPHRVAYRLAAQYSASKTIALPSV